MQYLDTVWEVAESFVSTAKHVEVQPDQIPVIVEVIQGDLQEARDGTEPIPQLNTRKDLLGRFDRTSDLILLDLMASSVNYCYWYGKHTVRPNGSSSSVMYNLLEDSFRQNTTSVFSCFRSHLITNRFPMLAERIRHLKEVMDSGQTFWCDLARAVKHGKPTLEEWFPRLIETLPGFAEDVFLKRAILFFTMLYRRHRWFEDDIACLPIPADYQIPRILHGHNVLRYTSELEGMLEQSKLIPKGSLMECEIRASSLVACREIARVAKCNMCDVDTALFKRRHHFHL